MLRRTKSSSLLPIVRLTNYFYPELSEEKELGMMATPVMDVFDPRVSAAGRSTGVSAQGSLTHPPDYEQLYQAMQMQSYDDNGGSERVRKKYACQGNQEC